MEVSATLKSAKISSQKIRLVADQIRGLSAEKAIDILRFSPKKCAAILKKVLDSAIANAEHNEAADIDELKVSAIQINDGPIATRHRPRARGRVNYISKRCSHITVTVSDLGGES